MPILTCGWYDQYSIVEHQSDYTIRVTDIPAKPFTKPRVKAGSTNYNLNASSLNSGMYFIIWPMVHKPPKHKN